MKRIRPLIRVVAVFLLLNMVNYVLAPCYVLALTAGPTAPEATSFEPVDTTDMVNMLTGDFNYNIPLLEVPGPSGGYPLSLSYHSGLMMAEEASWVGLGWTLNPGSINRSVSGFADDFAATESANRFVWDGVEGFVAELGATVGIGQMVGVSAGISVGKRTNEGWGAGASLGAQLMAELGGTGIGGVSASVRLDPWGNVSAGAGLSAGLSVAGVNVGSGIGLSTSGFSASVGASVTYGKPANLGNSKLRTSAGRMNLVGASIASGGPGIRSSLTTGGVNRSIGNSRMGKISSFTKGFTTPTPFLYLSFQYFRYWIDETETINTNGVMYYPTDHTGAGWYDNNSYDTYHLHTLDSELEQADPTRVNGGSLPDYDVYNVNAQGLSGNIRPYLLRKYLVNENTKYEDTEEKKSYDVITYPLGYDTRRPHFRFINDFSNRHRLEPDDFGVNTSSPEPLGYGFDAVPVTGENGTDGIIDNHLAGSRHVEYLTNGEIVQGDARVAQTGFMDVKPGTFDRSLEAPDQVGAFVITNASGVTYHFALPAYASDELAYTENINDQDGNTYSYQIDRARYAYTWYLTAITGPDFVDRAPLGTFGPEDWGYWVEFEYGKWSDNYTWRNPGEGVHTDVDDRFRNFSQGRKELYYLDMIRTKTHTALFVKETRNDARSTVWLPVLDELDISGSLSALSKEGGFTPVYVENYPWHYQGMSVLMSGYLKPVSSLKLNRIVLLRNRDMDQVSFDKSAGYLYGQNMQVNYVSFSSSGQATIRQHMPENIVDTGDPGLENLYTRALRIIDFHTNYELVPETANSYRKHWLADETPSTNPDDYPRTGKLTLQSVQIRGRGGTAIIPPIVFDYDLPAADGGEAYLTATDEERIFGLSAVTGQLHNGDIVRIYQDGKTIFGLVQSLDEPAVLRILGRHLPVNGTVRWHLTKNPPYREDAYDHWGYYKGDYRQSDNENIARLVTKTSSVNQDAWCLRSILTSLGGEIQIIYETDSYSRAPLYYNQSLIISELTDADVEAGTVRIHIMDAGSYLNEMFSVGDWVKVLLLYYENYHDEFSENGENEDVQSVAYYDVQITELENNSMVVEDYNMLQFFWNYTDTNDPPDGSPALVRTLVGGNVMTANERRAYGGGVRVKELVVDNAVVRRQGITRYDYVVPGTDISSGVTPYEPVGINKYSTYGFEEDSELIKMYKGVLFNSFSRLLLNAREVPPPGVMYEYVTVQESVRPYDGEEELLPYYTTYRFEVFNNDMVSIDVQNTQQRGEVNMNNIDKLAAIRSILLAQGESAPVFPVSTTLVSNTVTVKDYTARLGSLLDITTYDKQGNKLSRIINHYKHIAAPADWLAYEEPAFYDMGTYTGMLTDELNGQGIIEETFAEARLARDYREARQGQYTFYAVLTKREEYPVVATGQTTINYRSGLVTTDMNRRFDFYSGAPVEVVSTDSYGHVFVTETRPAYRVADAQGNLAYPSMGLKIYDPGNCQMLTQEGLTLTYRVNPDNPDERLGLVSASAQTWKQDWTYREANGEPTPPHQVWRKHRSYTWAGRQVLYQDQGQELRPDGLYEVAAYQDFTAWNGGVAPEGWQLLSEITLYNPYSSALEARDINGQYAATKTDLQQEQVTATVANARYDEFAFSGAEDIGGSDMYMGGHVARGEAVVETGQVHTGRQALRVSGPGQRAFVFAAATTAGKDYRAMVWSNSPDALIKATGASQVQRTVARAGDWHLVVCDFTTTGTAPVFWCESAAGAAVFDDFRVHPLTAAMTSYVYNEWGEVAYILDAGNLYTRYEYDSQGRLRAVYRERIDRGEVQVSAHEITYARQYDDLDGLAIVAPSAIPAAQTVVFSTTLDPANSYRTYSYYWDFGDGITSTSAMPEVSFAESGTRWIVLRVENDLGAFNEVALKINVE